MDATSPSPASVPVAAREDRPPVLAILAPLFYVAACAGAALWAKSVDPSADVGVQGLLIAVGLVPAFVIPAIFGTRSVLVAVASDCLVVDGRAIAAEDVRLQHGARGTARIHVDADGETRTFHFASAKDAERLASQLPPISARSVAMGA
jgi:hypothetical protein